MKLLSTILLIGAFTISQAQPLVYYTGFDNATEKSGWTQYKLGVNSAPYEWTYATMNAYSAPECLMHNYPVSATQTTDDWFVSSNLGLTAGGKIDSLRYSFGGFGTPMAGDTVALYLLKGSQDPAAATSKIILYNFTDSTYLNDNVWRQILNVSIPGIAGSSYIAFRYTTTNNWLDVKFDNLAVFINDPVGIHSHSSNVFRFYPNPASHSISWKNEVEQVQIFDLQGRLVYSVRGNLNTVSVADFPAGIYVVEAMADGEMWREKLVVE